MPKLIELARFTPDVVSTTDFYRQLLGHAPDRQFEGMAEFELGDVTLRIHKTYEAQGNDLPAEDHIAFAVENLEKACREAEASGLKLEAPPRSYEWGKSAYLRDPDGRLIELHEQQNDQ